MARVTERSAVAKAALAAYALLAGWVLVATYLQYPVPEGLSKLLAVAAAAWLAFALHSAGSLVVWLAGWLTPVGWIDELGAWTARLLRSLVGFSALTFLIIVIGAADVIPLSVLMRLLFGVVVAASVGGFFLPGRKHARRKIDEPPGAPAFFLALPAAGAVASFLTSFSPITHYDSLVYHLALPSLYLAQGAISAIPFNLYSAFPGACEAFFAFILAVLPEPEYVINLLGWSLAAVLGGAIAEWGEDLAGRTARPLSLALWWTMPPVLLLAQGAYVDLPLAAATFVAIRCYAAASHRADAGAAMLFAGFFCGTAFSIKYTGGVSIAILAAHRLWSAGSGRGSHLFRFIGAALACPAPWLLKNVLWFGNPVFPFFYQWLGGHAGWTTETAAGYFSMLTEYGARSNVLFDLIRPWAEPGRGGFDVLGDFGWPLLLLAAPAGYLFRRGDRDVRLLGYFAAASFAVWFATKPVLRFLVGSLPVFLLLATVALHDLWESKARIVRGTAAFMAGALILTNVFLYGLAAGELRLFAVPMGEIDAKAFLRQRLSFYPTFEWLNASSAQQDTVLLLGEQRTYHLRVPFLTSNLFAPSPVSTACNMAKTARDFSRFLSDSGIKRIVVNEGELARLGGLRKFGFSVDGENTFRDFLKNGARRISSDRSVDLYELSPFANAT